MKQRQFDCKYAGWTPTTLNVYYGKKIWQNNLTRFYYGRALINLFLRYFQKYSIKYSIFPTVEEPRLKGFIKHQDKNLECFETNM